MSSLSDRLDAKRFNAFLNLLASSQISLAVGIAIGAVILPYVNHDVNGSEFHVLWLVGAVILYVCALAMTQFLVTEE